MKNPDRALINWLMWLRDPLIAESKWGPELTELADLLEQQNATIGQLRQAVAARDDWIRRQPNYPATGLLAALQGEPYFTRLPPKSTGRDLFHADWLATQLQGFEAAQAADVQATLAAFTARTIAAGVLRDAPDAEAVYVCGGGALNGHLMATLQGALSMPVLNTDELGIAPMHVEAIAFAWLAMRFCRRLPGNLPSVTGAAGPRVLGALYPA